LNIIKGNVWYKNRIVKAGININDGIITKIGKESTLPKSNAQFNIKGKLIIPGLIDVHSHLRDLDLSYKEDYLSGTSAAIAGGYTTVLDMPNSKPPATTPESVKDRIKVARKKIFCDIGFYATPRIPEEVSKLKEAGCISFKIFINKSLDGEKYSSEEEIIRLLKSVKKSNLLLCVHAEDKALINYNYKGSPEKIHEKSHPPQIEGDAINKILSASKKIGGRLHVCHVSTSGGLRRISEARKSGVDVSCEATPHHACLTRNIFKKYGRKAIVEPPLRSKKHQEAILKGISNGEIDIIATDHAPHTISEKDRLLPGFPNLEITLPVFLTYVKKGLISLERVLSALTVEPAKRFSLKSIGSIDVGKKANLAVVDLNKKKKINASSFFSKAKYSPFDNITVHSQVFATFVRGVMVYLDGQIIESPGIGEVIHG
jgi:dihydroorotase